MKLIAAVAKNGIIGINNKLPWKLPSDLIFFKEITDGQKLIAGYSTYTTLPFLHGRDVILDDGSWTSDDNVIIIGGGATYQHYMGIAKHLYITHIDQCYDGDVKFPIIPNNQYEIISKSTPINDNDITYQITEYIRIHEEMQYLNAIQHIIDYGDDRGTRGHATKSISGLQMKFSLTNQFPLLTSKKMFWRGIVEELLWFIRGETDVKILQDKNIHIWDGNVGREYLDSKGLISYCDTDPGPIYGHSFRHYGDKYIGCNGNYVGIDQLRNAIELIIRRPYSRKIIIDLWNPCCINDMSLPPCHILYQFIVTSDNKINLVLSMRSGDMGLGVPFNIASASLLTYIISNITGYKPGELIITIGDAHIYVDHINELLQQVENIPYKFPILHISKRIDIDSIVTLKFEDFILENYVYHPSIKMKLIN